MIEFNEHIIKEEEKEKEQHKFNKKFLIKLIVFMFFYRFYIMHIDTKGTLINYIEDFITEMHENKVP